MDKSGEVPAHRPDLGPCWMWTGALNSGGYGHIFLNRAQGKTKLAPAYRVSYEMGEHTERRRHNGHQCEKDLLPEGP